MGYFVGVGIGVLWMTMMITFSFTDKDIQKFTERCEKNGGVEKVYIDIGNPKVVCKDSAKFTIKGE